MGAERAGRVERKSNHLPAPAGPDSDHLVGTACKMRPSWEQWDRGHRKGTHPLQVQQGGWYDFHTSHGETKAQRSCYKVFLAQGHSG